jgi:hypothetical protein
MYLIPRNLQMICKEYLSDVLIKAVHEDDHKFIKYLEKNTFINIDRLRSAVQLDDIIVDFASRGQTPTIACSNLYNIREPHEMTLRRHLAGLANGDVAPDSDLKKIIYVSFNHVRTTAFITLDSSFVPCQEY